MEPEGSFRAHKSQPVSPALNHLNPVRSLLKSICVLVTKMAVKRT